MTAPSTTTQPPPRSWLAVLICVLVAALLIAVDLGSKKWASEHLSRARFGNTAQACTPDESGYTTSVRVSMPPKVVIENLFELRYAENCGAAFGLFNQTNSPWKKVLFYGAAIGAVVALLAMFRQGRGGLLFVLSVPTIIAGAVGNFHDRVQLGYVVDFIRFFYHSWEYPTFNVADIAITVGVTALVIDGIREEIAERRARKGGERESGERLASAKSEAPAETPEEPKADEAAAEAPVEKDASSTVERSATEAEASQGTPDLVGG